MANELPLGLRNLNIGNMRPPAGDQWLGTVGVGSGFIIFDSMEHGIRALGKQLISYVEGYRKTPPVIGKIGHDSNDWVGLIPTWAPPNENNTAAYVAAVCKVCELAGDVKINVRDPDTLYWLIVAIGEQENGRQSFRRVVTEAQLDAGLKMALA